MTNDPGSPTATRSEAGGVSNSLDTAFELLARERRRKVLYCLRDSDGLLSLSELADRIAEREASKSAGDVYQEITISLSQVHLPKLEDAGVIDYDHAERRIEHQGDPFVDMLLARAARIER